MILTIQKADMWKRIAAAVLDLILVLVASTGFALAVSAISGYDGYVSRWDAAMDEYGRKYGVDFRIGAEDFEKLTQEEKDVYNEAYRALRDDESAMRNFTVANSLIIVITSVGLFLGFLLTEFVIPLILKNGVTVGKKVFGLCVIGTDSVKIGGITLFIRAILGKYAVETMIPVMLGMMFFLGNMGLLAPAVIIVFLVIQIILIGTTENRTPLHDILSYTVVADVNSTMIFDSADARDARIAEYGDSRGDGWQ